jgi:hypothetical protein
MLKVTVKDLEKFDLEVPIDCPGCGKKVGITARQAAPGKVFKCSCGASIVIKGDGGQRAQTAIDNLLKTISRFGKR